MDNNINENEFLIINSRAKACLLKYISNFIKSDNETHIQPKDLIIDIFSTSEKSMINKIYYSMLIRKNNYDPKFDIKKNLQIYKILTKYHSQLKDECNNNLSENEIHLLIENDILLGFYIFVNFF